MNRKYQLKSSFKEIFQHSRADYADPAILIADLDFEALSQVIRYNMEPQTVALIDSVALVRTHLDRNSYGLIGSQMTVNRQGEPAKPASALPHPTRPAPDAHELRDRADDEARATFRPKPGVNKSSHPRHIEHSPNSQHLPK